MLTLFPLLGLQPYAYWSLDEHIAPIFSLSHLCLAAVVAILIYLTYVSRNGLLMIVLTFASYLIGGTTLNLAAFFNSTPPVAYIIAGHIECLLMFSIAVRAPWLLITVYGCAVIGVFICIMHAAWALEPLDANIATVALAFVVFLVSLGGYTRDRQTYQLYLAQDKNREFEAEKANWNRLLTKLLKHELSNQIAGIGTSFQMLKREPDLHDNRFIDRGMQSVVELGQVLQRATEAMNLDDLVENLDIQSIELGELADDVVQEYEELPHSSTELVLENKASTNDYLVLGDYLLLKQMLRNIVNNAIRHADAGTAVRIVLTHNGNLDIVNRGPSLPEDTSSMFTLGTRLRPGIPGQYGLGLYLAMKIATAHGGYISARNPREFSGAIFSVFLPRAEQSKTL